MPWAPDYAMSADLKAYLRITDALDDAQIALAVTAASRAVDRATHRQFGKVASAEARLYTPRWEDSRCRWVVVVDDLMDTTGLTVSITAGAITQYQLWPVNAAQRGKPWTRLVISDQSTIKPKGDLSEATVTALWGWTAVPDAIKQATLMQAARLVKRRDAPFGVAGSPESGSEVRLLAKLDPDVEIGLASYTRRKLATGRR